MTLTHCITRAPRKPGELPIPPERSDGSRYEWAIRLSDRIGWADSISELVGVLVNEPGYLDLSSQDQAYHRVLQAIRLQVSTQARINLIAQTMRDDWEQACEWERRILNGPRHVQPHDFDSRPLFAGRDVWTCPIPLLLVRTGFYPYSEVHPVEGNLDNVWWMDPSTDESFLDSLIAEPLGLIQVWRLTEGA